MNMQCLIVDDESLARDMLEVYAGKLEGLEVVGKCKNVQEAEKAINKARIDLIFMDIEMPQGSGLDFVRSLSQSPLIIFTTAYSDYALEGFELQVVDYLLKPIGFDRFSRAVTHAQLRWESLERIKSHLNPKLQVPQELTIKEGYNYHKLSIKDILYIEAMREYIAYHTPWGKILELRSLSDLESHLPEESFVRIHRSYLVAKSMVRSQEKNKLILANGKILPLGKTYRKEALRSIFELR